MTFDEAKLKLIVAPTKRQDVGYYRIEVMLTDENGQYRKEEFHISVVFEKESNNCGNALQKVDYPLSNL